MMIKIYSLLCILFFVTFSITAEPEYIVDRSEQITITQRIKRLKEARRSDDYIPLLIHAVSKDSSEKVRAFAMLQIYSILRDSSIKEAAQPHVRRALQYEKGDVRIYALECIEQMSDTASVSLLYEIVKDTSLRRRENIEERRKAAELFVEFMGLKQQFKLYPALVSCSWNGEAYYMIRDESSTEAFQRVTNEVKRLITLVESNRKIQRMIKKLSKL